MARIQEKAQKDSLKKNAPMIKSIFSFVFQKYPVHLFLVLVCIIITVFSNVQGTLFMKTLIDGYISPMTKKVLDGQNADYTPLMLAILRVAMFYGGGIVASFVQGLLMARVTQGTLDDIRQRVFTHMENLPIRYFDTHAHGDIMSVYTNDIDTLRQMISQSIPQFVSSLITIVAVVVSMIRLNIILTIVSLAMVGVMMLATKKIAGLSGRYYMTQQKEIARVNGYIEEMLNGQKVIQVFTHENKAIEEFVEMNQQLFEAADSANTYANVLMPVNGQLGNISYVLSAMIGGALALNGVGGFTLGALAAFLTFNKSFSMPINQVSQQLNFIVMGAAGARRIFDVLEQEKEIDDGQITLVNVKEQNGTLIESEERTGLWAWKKVDLEEGTVDFRKVEGKVVFDDVNFSYLPNKQILFDITLFAEPGQKLAFVGATGAGKTTIINLLNRFYDVEDGRIRIDGVNINKIKKSDLRHAMGFVLQDTHLFTGTVADNIRFGKLDASDEEVVNAAKLANAHDFIMHLPEGYQTVLTGDGANLSQGQRQLLAIARAAIYNPPVLVLDEATSSIDTRSEKLVQEGLDKLMAGRTSFVIAHRLSTIRNSDCIMVMERGRIIERGSHAELLEKQGRYGQLYTGKVVND